MAESTPDQAARQGLKQLLSEAEIRRIVGQLAADIARDHPPGRTLVVAAAMKGALLFVADLIRRLPMPLELELLRARSYDGRRRDDVTILDEAQEIDVTSRHVLLVDCVLDSGHTVHALRRSLLSRRPASVKTCVLLRKQREREVPVEPEYVGCDVPDVFVVGYGLDHANAWRHLPYVAQLSEGIRAE